MRHEFILLRVSIPDMTDLWIRIDRTPCAPKGPFTTMKLFMDAPTNDTVGNDSRGQVGPLIDAYGA